jgi:hypothetical protein
MAIARRPWLVLIGVLLLQAVAACSAGDGEAAPGPAAPAVTASAEPSKPAHAPPGPHAPATPQQKRLLAAQEQARALAVGLAPAQVPAGAHDCGEDLTCFAERGKRCESAVVRSVVGMPMASSVTDMRVGAESDAERCQYQQQIVAMTMAPPSEAMRKALAASGQDMGAYEEKAAGAFEQLKAKGEDKLTCFYPRERLAQVLDDAVAGRARTRSDDWEHCYRGNGECTDVPLVDGCVRQECQRGRLSFRCASGKQVEQCTTVGLGGLLICNGCKLGCEAGKVTVHGGSGAH